MRQIVVDILLRLWRRLISPPRRVRYEREMEEEMRFHLEMQAEQNLAADKYLSPSAYLRDLGG
jgi:hypothetical protein